MKVITYRVKLLEPTLVTSLQGDPNSAVSFDYVPGSVLRGMVISKYLNSASTNASDDNFRRLFLDSTTRYLHGYPLDEYEQLALPVPLSWQRAKTEHDGTICDFAVKIPEDKEQRQGVSKPFYLPTREGVQLLQPARTIAVHTQRTARFGRAMPRSREKRNDQARGQSTALLHGDEIIGAVYRYEALAADQSFQAKIICEHDADASTLLPFIEGYASLGGARSSGYGRAEISQVQVHDPDSAEEEMDDEDELLEESGGDEAMPTHMLIVTLQSDTLVRDARGQFAADPDLLCQVLSKHLQMQLVLKDAFLGTRVVGGFNRTWSLPLPQALAVRMGSVLIFQDPGCDPNVLKTLEARGIGERRAEGFGQLAFNQQQRATLKIVEHTLPANYATTFTINEPEASEFAQRMTRRMLKRRLDEGLRAAANEMKIVNPPSNAQLSRLRSIVLTALRQTPPNTRSIREFLQSIESRGSARRQFERSTINNGQSLLNWLKEQIHVSEQDGRWKRLLRLEDLGIDDLEIGGVKATRDDALRLEYVLRLIDLVLAHATKQRGEED